MSNYPFFKNPAPCRLIVFKKSGENCIYPDAHISAIINSINNEGVKEVQFLRNGTVVVALFDQYSALKFARSLPPNHSYDKVLIFRDDQK